MRTRGIGRTALAWALVAGVVVGAGAQSGRHSDSERGKEVLHIIVQGDGTGSAPQLSRDSFDLYDGGISQTIEAMQLDQSPARIVLLADNTRTLKVGLDVVKAAAHSIVDELYEGDRMMMIAYDESPYVVQEFTTDLNALDTSTEEKFKKAGDPRLFDALEATLTDALEGVHGEKRAVVVIGDGYDRGSKTKFDTVVARLQREAFRVRSGA
jgi:hypothetical protein